MARRTRPGQTRTWFDKGRAVFFIGLIHIAPAIALVRGTNRADWLALAVLYPAFAFSATIVLHRYFAHGSFRTGRLMQGAMGAVASTMFVDPISFVGKHRLHHRFADTPRDVHSPHEGFWYCWLGSLVDEGYSDEEIVAAAADLTRYPELRWLHANFIVPGLVVWGGLFAIGGFSMFAIGYCLSLAVVLNQASLVNYCCHRWGYRTYATRDESRNNALVAALTLGEGWHNNHHRFPRSARAGLAPGEVDPLYGIIRVMAALGLARDVVVAKPDSGPRTNATSDQPA
jgi:stearoyl-CoA desaturase (delta-9 desaturase)